MVVCMNSRTIGLCSTLGDAFQPFIEAVNQKYNIFDTYITSDCKKVVMDKACYSNASYKFAPRMMKLEE